MTRSLIKEFDQHVHAVARYEYRVFWSPEDVRWVAACSEFPSRLWLDWTPELALAGLRQLLADAVADMYANGELDSEGATPPSTTQPDLVRVDQQSYFCEYARTMVFERFHCGGYFTRRACAGHCQSPWP